MPTEGESRPLCVFLCHSSGDKNAVRDLYKRLCAEGFDPWLDEEKLLPGQDWQQEIPKAVRASDVVIVCLSPRAINKAGYIHKEIKYALDVADEQPEGSIFIIPLKLEECDVPERLRRWHWANYFEESGYKRLVHALRKVQENAGRREKERQIKIHKPEQQPTLSKIEGQGEYLTIVKTKESIPEIANAISDLASGVKKGTSGKGEIEDLNVKIKEFGKLGDSIIDYMELLGLSSDLDNRIDHMISRTIPDVKRERQRIDGIDRIIQTEYASLQDLFSKHLNKFFMVKRNIDTIGEGEIATSIRKINDLLNQGSNLSMSEKYDDLVHLLVGVSTQLNHIKGLSVTKINNISKHLSQRQT